VVEPRVMHDSNSTLANSTSADQRLSSLS